MNVKEKLKGFIPKKIGLIFGTATAAIYIIFFAVEYFWLSNYSASGTLLQMELKWNWGLATFLAQVLYTLVSLRIVGPTELGALLLFGKPICEVSSGLIFAPLGIIQLKKETRLTIQDELPTDPQHIFRREDTENVPPGFFPPIRIPFGFRQDAEKLSEINVKTSDEDENNEVDEKKHQLVVPPDDDPLDLRVTAEVVPVIRWRIDDYIQFLTTIGSQEEARKQMEDCAIGSLTREFAKITPAVALANLGTYSACLQFEINKRIENWGISMESAQIKMINFHRDLNTAIGAVPQAKLEKERDRLAGEGLGAKEKGVLDGRTAGLKKMMNDLNIPGTTVLGAETARAITSNPGQKTIVAGSSGFSELVTIASAIGENLKKKEE
ncbi:MAG: SPFH domain-containing protein [Spirochaetota bacterium]